MSEQECIVYRIRYPDGSLYHKEWKKFGHVTQHLTQGAVGAYGTERDKPHPEGARIERVHRVVSDEVLEEWDVVETKKKVEKRQREERERVYTETLKANMDRVEEQWRRELEKHE